MKAITLRGKVIAFVLSICSVRVEEDILHDVAALPVLRIKYFPCSLSLQKEHLQTVLGLCSLLAAFLQE